MGQFCWHRQNRLAPQARPRLLPGPTHSAERSVATQAWLGHPERNRFQRQAESAARRPKAHPSLRRQKTAKSQVSPVGAERRN
jgi:hypothetical protein